MEPNLTATKPSRGVGAGQSANRYGSGGGIRPTHDQIAARAKAIWQSKGCPTGKDEENWREAEELLRQGR